MYFNGFCKIMLQLLFAIPFPCIKLTVPLKSKLPVASCFRHDANHVARYANRVARYAICVVQESSKRKMSGIN